MLKIYGIPTLNTTKILLTAEEIGLDYQFIQVDFANGEHKTVEFMQMHPLGKVPAIDDSGNYLFESNAICRYLAVKHASPLYQGNALEKALIDQWLDMVAHHAGKWMGVFFFEEAIRPKIFDHPPRKEPLIEAQEYLDLQMPIIDKQLANDTFFTGNQLTIADIVAFSFVHTHESTSLTLNAYPNIGRWYQQIKTRDSFGRAMANYPVQYP